MAERPFERYLKDKEETEEIVPGEPNSIDEIKESFQKGLIELLTSWNKLVYQAEI